MRTKYCILLACPLLAASLTALYHKVAATEKVAAISIINGEDVTAEDGQKRVR